MSGHSHDDKSGEAPHTAICGPSQLVKIDDGQSVHVRTAREWLDLARRDFESKSKKGARAVIVGEASIAKLRAKQEVVLDSLGVTLIPADDLMNASSPSHVEPTMEDELPKHIEALASPFNACCFKDKCLVAARELQWMEAQPSATQRSVLPPDDKTNDPEPLG